MCSFLEAFDGLNCIQGCFDNPFSWKGIKMGNGNGQFPLE